MAYWLLKSEPATYSWDDLVRDGQTRWDGVRNFAARNNLQSMRVGDEGLFYHSNDGKACVGIVKVVKEAEPDEKVTKAKLNKDGSNPWVVVTLAPVRALKMPVTLEMVKGEKRLEKMELVVQQRLSVQKVTAMEWKRILEMSGG